MAGGGLVLSEVALLGEVLARREPGLVAIVERIGSAPIDDAECERIRRAVVDELCELPDAAGRRALELEELLIHLKDL